MTSGCTSTRRHVRFSGQMCSIVLPAGIRRVNCTRPVVDADRGEPLYLPAGRQASYSGAGAVLRTTAPSTSASAASIGPRGVLLIKIDAANIYVLSNARGVWSREFDVKHRPAGSKHRGACARIGRISLPSTWCSPTAGMHACMHGF
jgi:hypothetical protein